MTRTTFISFLLVAVVAVALTPLISAIPFQGTKTSSKHQLSFEEAFRVRDTKETTEPAEEVPTCGTLCIGKPEICNNCQCGGGPEVPCRCQAIAVGVALCRPNYNP